MQQPESTYFRIRGGEKSGDQSIRNIHLLNQPIKQVAVGFGHIFVLCESGQVFTFGRNDAGQLGYSLPVDCEHEYIWDVKRLEWDYERNGPVKSVHCGSLHTLIVTSENTVFAAGSNSMGQLGIKEKSEQEWIEKFARVELPSDLLPSQIDRVHAKFAHSGILTKDHKLYCCGRNHDFEIGIPKYELVFSFSKILNIPGVKLFDFSWKYTIVITLENEIYSSKYGILETEKVTDTEHCNEYIIKYPKWNHGNIVKVECGTEHTVLLTSSNELYGFGYCKYGQMGNGDSEKLLYKHPIRIGKDVIHETIHDFTCSYENTCIIGASGGFYVTGTNRKQGLTSTTDDIVYTFTKELVSNSFNSALIGSEMIVYYHSHENQNMRVKKMKRLLHEKLILGKYSFQDVTIITPTY